MSEKPPEIPKHIASYNKWYKISDDLVNTVEMQHSKAFTVAADEHLWDKEKKLYILDRLKSGDTRKKMASSMNKFYVGLANEYLKAKVDPEDKLGAAMISDAYSGWTQDEIQSQLDKHQQTYDAKKHEAARDKYMQPVRQRLGRAAASDVTDENARDFLKDWNVESIIDGEKVKKEDILTLASLRQRNGTLSRDMITGFYRANDLGEPLYFKKKEEEGKKK